MQNVEAYVKGHPTFSIEEIQDHLRTQHSNLKNILEAKFWRVLNFDLRLVRKNLMKVAREVARSETQNYDEKLKSIHIYPK